MLVDELKMDKYISGWSQRELDLLQLLINEMRVPLRSAGVRGPDERGELYRQHSTIRRLLRPIVKSLSQEG